MSKLQVHTNLCQADRVSNHTAVLTKLPCDGLPTYQRVTPKPRHTLEAPSELRGFQEAHMGRKVVGRG